MKYVKFRPKISFQRILEIIPGFLIWIFLFSPVWGGITFPELIIIIFVILSVYWVYRSIIMTIGSMLGYFRVRNARMKDWLQECLNIDRSLLLNPEELPDTILPKQLIVIPNYGEDYAVLSRSIRAIMDQNYPKELLYLAVSIEERKAKKDPEYAKRGEYLKRDFGAFFGDRLFCFEHPSNIPGEEIGAASNRSWGTKNTVMELEKRGEDISKFLITAPDGDLVFDKQYFAALSYKWIVAENRNQKFYQTALYTFNNNYWDVPMLVRILMIGLTMPVLASSVMEKHKRETWSCFTLNLKLMKDVNYWDTSIAVGADDTTFYWRPYFYLEGNWECEVFYIPLSADAIYHPNYFKNHMDQYKQYVRWGWGVISFPLATKLLLKDRKIGLFTKVVKLYHLFEVFVFWKVLAFLIAFGIPIVFLFNQNLNNETISIYVPQAVSRMLTLSTILLLPNTIIKLFLIPPRPDKMSRFRYILLLIIEAPLNIVSLFTFSFLPFIDASTRMMLGTRGTTVQWSEKQVANK